MKIITKKIICIVFACLCFATAHAYYDVCIDGIYYNLNKDDKTAEVTSGLDKYSGSVSIPESITNEGVAYSVTSIGMWAFENCTGLTSITIPNSVTSIGNSAFYECTGLTSITIPNSVTSIGGSAFEYCTGLTSVTIGNSVTSIGNFAFAGCKGLTSVTIPNSVTDIGDYTFWNCTGLTSVTIGNSVTSIGDYTFYKCTGLTSVTIGNSVTRIEDYAFGGCSSLKSITSLAVTPPTCSSLSFDGIDKQECILNVPEESVDLYKAAYGWEDFYNIVGFTSGIDNAANYAAQEIFVRDGAIYVDGCPSTAVEVYDANGKRVSSTARSVVSGLPHGLYIVKAGKMQKKIVL